MASTLDPPRAPQTVGGPSAATLARVGELREQLYASPDLTVFGILDGASCKDLIPNLRKHAPDHQCLFAGKLDPSVEQTAPYIVELDPSSKFTEWVLADGWGCHWGIFATTEVDLKTLRRHLKTFLLVTTPGGKQLYFRYYDPRVFRVYLPTCNALETEQVFGPVAAYLMEDEKAESFLVFRPGSEAPKLSEFPIRGAGPPA